MILLDIIWSKSQNSAVVLLEASNSSTLGSGIRPPIVGYSDWWNNGLGKELNNFATKIGIMSKTTQKIIWIEKYLFNCIIAVADDNVVWRKSCAM